MTIIKKLLAILLALALVLGICGCAPAGEDQGEAGGEATGFRVGYAREKIMPYGIRSPYMANAIVSFTKRGATINLELHTISIGDSVAFCTANCELFDTNGAYVEDNSPYEHTIVCGYTNGQYGYLASAIAWEYTCYETDIAKFAPGSAEQVADQFPAMLKTHKGEA